MQFLTRLRTALKNTFTRPSKKIFLESEALEWVSYDARHQSLQVGFCGGSTAGRTYEYEEVPPKAFSGLMEADSKGRYFGKEIRPNFSYRRLDTKELV